MEFFMRNKKTRDQNPPEIIKENIDQEKKLIKMINEIRSDLKTNPQYKNFFDKYNPLSVESFIDNYAIRKSRYLTFGEMLSKNEENTMLRQQIEADERLWEIQRKKLFDLECRWRAEQIEIEQIEISADFEFWSKNIENCPFLEKITEDDYELYLEYLLSDGFYDYNLDFSWMGYVDIKQSLSEDGNIPPWYEFYDIHKGTGSLLFLPDIRGEKEEYYLNLWKKNIAETKKKQKKKSVTLDSRPRLYGYDLSVIENFIKKFENKRLLEYFKLYEKELNKSNDEVDQAIQILKESDEMIPIESHYDWRSAVIQAARRLEQRKIADSFKQAYKKYLYRDRVGIAHEIHSNENSIEWVKDWVEELKREIIEARRMNNEPANLNF